MFDEIFDKIVENKERLESGKYNCIPLPFKRLRKYIPGIVRGRVVIATANSGVGKTQISKFIYLYHAFKWCREHGTPLKIFYFALEESKEEFIANALSFFLKDSFNIELAKDSILSMGETPLNDNYLSKIKQLAPLVNEFLEVVDIQDNISNPTGIFKYLKNYAELNGVTHYKDVIIDNQKKQVFDYYEPNDPDEYRIVITDHIGLLQRNNDYFMRDNLEFNDLLDTLEKII